MNCSVSVCRQNHYGNNLSLVTGTPPNFAYNEKDELVIISGNEILYEVRDKEKGFEKAIKVIQPAAWAGMTVEERREWINDNPTGVVRLVDGNNAPRSINIAEIPEGVRQYVIEGWRYNGTAIWNPENGMVGGVYNEGTWIVAEREGWIPSELTTGETFELLTFASTQEAMDYAINEIGIWLNWQADTFSAQTSADKSLTEKMKLMKVIKYNKFGNAMVCLKGNKPNCSQIGFNQRWFDNGIGVTAIYFRNSETKRKQILTVLDPLETVLEMFYKSGVEGLESWEN